MSMRLALLVLVLLPAAAQAAQAAPGDVDRRFGSKGVVRSERLEGATVATLERSGHVLIAGGSFAPGVARIDARGRFDRRFGDRGIALARGAGTYIPFGVRREPSGGVLVGAGAEATPGPSAAFLRWDPQGRGAKVLPAAEPFVGPLGGGLLRQDGGAYLLSGTSYYESPPLPELRALRPDGTTDTAFAGGTVFVCPLKERDCGVSTMEPTRGGVIVSLIAFRRSFVVRMASDGRVLRRTTVPFGVSALKELSDGSILAAGTPRYPGKAGFPLLKVARIGADGRLDRSFGRRGIATAGRISARRGSIVADVETDPERRIYVLANRARRAVVTRLRPGGRPDRSFGRDGSAGPRAPRAVRDTDRGLDLVLDRRRGVVVVGVHLDNGSQDPVYGCGIREDFCAEKVELRVWRLHR